MSESAGQHRLGPVGLSAFLPLHLQRSLLRCLTSRAYANTIEEGAEITATSRELDQVLDSSAHGGGRGHDVGGS